MKKEFYIFLLAFLFVGQSLAHGELHERIKVVSEEIKTFPDSAFLYLKRGELYFLHEDFQKSIMDFDSCTILGLDDPRLHLGFANSYGEIGKYHTAIEHLDKILTNNKLDVNALRLKGQLLYESGQYLKAAHNFEKVIFNAKKSFPELYIEASFAWENSNDVNALLKASESIIMGIEKLGDLLVFYNRLVEIHLKSKDYTSALIYQSKILHISNRKEKAYYKRALIHIENGDSTAAKQDLEMASYAIENLPNRIKKNKAMLNLIANIEQLIIAL